MATRKVLLNAARHGHLYRTRLFRSAASSNFLSSTPNRSARRTASSPAVGRNDLLQAHLVPVVRPFTSSISFSDLLSRSERHIATDAQIKRTRVASNTSLPDALHKVLQDNANVATVIGDGQDAPPVDVCISVIVDKILDQCYNSIESHLRTFYGDRYEEEKDWIHSQWYEFGRVKDLLDMPEWSCEIDDREVKVMNFVCKDVGELAATVAESARCEPIPFSARLSGPLHIDSRETLVDTKEILHEKGFEIIHVQNEHGVVKEIHYHFLVKKLLKNVATKLGNSIDMFN